jgi:dTDP-4-dehydrorhamnose reductase
VTSHDYAPALWGGIECTVNRVGDRYFDQLERSGHAQRASDIDLFADLGLTTLRYPVLWERIAPRGLLAADWSWPDERLTRLAAHGIRPIAGLVHHGSGPRGTDLLDPAFGAGLAAFAGEVAQRYPWVEDFTPINEPLTTARFSGLYGHWYPHRHDDAAFVRCLVTECRATQLAMRAIRRANPTARLIQTEDIGCTHSTPALAEQAAFENERRWLTFDLLSGRVDRFHTLWPYLLANGITTSELQPFLDEPCPPDLLGINYYITSERFLDERLERYPDRSHGGNGRQRYADVEAVRACPDGIAGLRAVLREAWERYRRPLAVTEAHLGSTRDEQLRWLYEEWLTVRRLRAEGVPVEALTVWALLGSFDWQCLVTQETGWYEPGAFDVRGPAPRPTALAQMVRDLTAGREPRHPVLDVSGWWRQPSRLIYGHGPATAQHDVTEARS